MDRRPATSLVDPDGLARLSGQPVLAVQQATLKAGQSLVRDWDALRPIVQKLTVLVRDYVEGDAALKPTDAAKLLSQCAGVIQKLSMASTGVLRASEGMAKLALLIDAGTVRRPDPAKQTEKQLAVAVVEATRRMVVPGKQCPTCHVLVPLPAETTAD